MTKEQIMDVERNNTAGYDFKTTHNPNDPIHKATEEEIMHGFVPALKTGEDAEEEIIELLYLDLTHTDSGLLVFWSQFISVNAKRH